jgi:hypothetical protein
MLFREEANSCRRQAAAYVGQPEGPFLLRVARAFDELALGNTARRTRRNDTSSPAQC